MNILNIINLYDEHSVFFSLFWVGMHVWMYMEPA